MARERNCPNCGGTTEGYFCPYCNTKLYEDSDIFNALPGKVSHLWIRDDAGRVMCFDIKVESVGNLCEDIMFVDDSVYMPFSTPKLEIIGRPLAPDRAEWTDVLTKAGAIGGDI